MRTPYRMPQLHGVDGGASSAPPAPVPSVRSFDAGAGRLPRMPVGGDVGRLRAGGGADRRRDRRSEEHTSELQSLMRISYAVFCLKKKNHRPPHSAYDLRRQPTTPIYTGAHTQPNTERKNTRNNLKTE